MDNFFETYSENSQTGLYNSLALLYDYIYNIHYDYDAQARVVEDNTEEVNSILEGACGTGRLTKRLNNKFDTVSGFDLNKGVLDIAEERNSTVTFHQDDFTDLTLDGSFDCYCVLGNSLVHLTDPTDFQAFADEAFNVLSEDGCLIFDCMEVSSIENGYSGTHTFEGDKYKIERDVITTKDNKYTYYMSFAFDILQKETGKLIQTGDTFLSRVYDKEYIQKRLQQAGFSEVQFRDYDQFGAEIDDMVIVAKK